MPVRIVSSIDGASQAVRRFLNDSAGSIWLNDELTLHIGDSAEHGRMSLSGVPVDDLAVSVDKSLWNCVGWFDVLAMIYPDSHQSDEFLKERRFYEFVLPVIDMANHSDTARPIISQGGRMELYGSEAFYWSGAFG